MGRKEITESKANQILHISKRYKISKSYEKEKVISFYISKKGLIKKKNMSIHIIKIKTKHKRFFRIKADLGDYFNCSECSVAKIHNINHRLIICRSCHNLYYNNLNENLPSEIT